MVKHFLIMRLGLGVYHLPWYESRLELFEAITFQSLRGQSDQNFIVLVVVDSRIPKPALSRLRDILGEAQNFHVVPLDLAAMRQVRHGCVDFVWDRCQEYLLEQHLIIDPFEYVITSIIDDDDAWHRDTVAMVRAQLEPDLPILVADESKTNLSFRHTRGRALTYPRGLKWFVHADVAQPFEYDFLGISVFVIARFSSGISVLSSRHPAWPAMAHIAVFEVKKIQLDRPMWVYVRHDQAETNWDLPTPDSDPACVAALHADFGIDFAKVDAWRAKQPLDTMEVPPIRHAGFAAREQLDCYFRITALNRQIDVLERKQQRDGINGKDELLLLQQQRTRLELLGRLQDQGHELFR